MDTKITQNNSNVKTEGTNGTLEKQINDIMPNQTLYVKNLNERIKIEGTRYA